jgi:DNA-binding PadR family transcriptional regulator
MPVALSSAMALVLDALSRGYRYGFDILEATGLPSGTVYPILRRLEHERLARSKWEDARLAQKEQRPPRRYYELTRDGQARAGDARARFPMLGTEAAGAKTRRA